MRLYATVTRRIEIYHEVSNCCSHKDRDYWESNLDFVTRFRNGHWVGPVAPRALSLAAQVCDSEAGGRLAP